MPPDAATSVRHGRTAGPQLPTAAPPAPIEERPPPPKANRTRVSALLDRRSRLTMWGGLFLGMAVYVVFGVGPAIANIGVSFTDYSGLAGSSTDFTGLVNYRALFTTERPGFVDSLIATAIFVVGVSVLQNLVALALAHRLQGTGRTAAIMRVLVFLPIVLGVTIVGLIWILIFDPSKGPAASLWSAFGLHSAFLGSDSGALPIVILVQIWQNVGFSTLIFVGGLRSINPEIYEAAAIDGVTPWRRFRHITFPLLAPSVTVNLLMAVIGSLTTYNLIYVLTIGQYHTNTLGMLAFNSAFGQSANLGYGATVTVVLFVVGLVVALPLMALLRRRERRLIPR